MNSLADQQTANRRLMDPEWAIAMAYGGPPPPPRPTVTYPAAPAEARVSRRWVPEATQSARRLYPEPRAGRTSPQTYETCASGTHAGRVAQAAGCLLAGFAALVLWVALAGGPGLVIGAIFALFGIGGCLARLFRPYELTITAAGHLTFVSVLGATEFDSADIVRIEFCQRTSDREFTSTRVDYREGSVTLDGTGEIAARLAGLYPQLVTTEVYDDRD